MGPQGTRSPSRNQKTHTSSAASLEANDSAQDRLPLELPNRPQKLKQGVQGLPESSSEDESSIAAFKGDHYEDDTSDTYHRFRSVNQDFLTLR